MEKVTTIRLNQKKHVLYIGNCSKDIDSMSYITLIYEVSHVTHDGNGWYDVYNGNGVIIGFVTDVENVEERW